MSTPAAIPFTPPPSVGHEIGVMFGFGGAMVLAMVGYLVFWRMANKRSAKRENERREALAQKGIYEGSTIGGGYSDNQAEKDGTVQLVEQNAL